MIFSYGQIALDIDHFSGFFAVRVEGCEQKSTSFVSDEYQEFPQDEYYDSDCGGFGL